MRKFGEIMVDHRASPGLTEQQARRFGYEPSQVKEGALFEAATMTCVHCGTIVIRNPLRVRERATCLRCNDYICDLCDAERRKPDYVHYSREAVTDMLHSGRWSKSGTDVQPVLTRKED
jgi:hypothetical protein